MKHKKINFPRKIKQFKFLNEISLDEKKSNYRFAVYLGPGKSKYFAKMWTGKTKSVFAQKLQKQAKVLEVLTRVYNRIDKKNFETSWPTVWIPTFKGLYEKGNRIIVLTSYSPGKNLGKIKNLFHRTAYFKTIGFLRTLGNNMTSKEKKIFTIQTGRSLIIAYPLLLLKSLIQNVGVRREILRGFPVFLRSVPYLLKLGFRQELSHRDLNFRSILKQRKKLSLVNLNDMAFTLPEYDLLTALADNWGDKAFQRMVFEELTISLGRPSYNHPYVLALMVYISTLYLSDKQYQDRKKIYYRGMLAYAVTHSILPDPRSFSWLRKIYYIVPSYLHSSIIYASGRKRTMKLPKTIGDYERISPIVTTSKYPYALGIYKTKEGLEVVAKIWQGNSYSAHAFNLLHEADVCRVLETIRLRVVAEMPEALASIITPAYHGCLVENGVIALFMSKAQGEPITNIMPPEEQLRTYNLVVSYLKYLGKQATLEERKVIGEKGLLNYLTIFPFIFFLAFFRHFSHSLEIVRGLYSFIFSIFSLYDEPKVLSHGDLHTDNILISEGKITLIDLEQTIFTYNGFDAFTTVSNTRSLTELRTKIEDNIWEDGKKSSHDASSLSGIGTFISILNLTSNLSPEYMRHCVSILKLSNALSVLWEHTPEMRLKSLRFPSFWGKKSN